MNAVAHAARDVGPVREMLVPVEINGRLITATVKFRVFYRSIWHRSLGWDPEINVIASTYEDGTEIRALPVRRDLHDAIVCRIEADELELN